MDVAVVGAGRVGTALGVLLGRAGHRVVAAAGRAASRERAARHLPHTPFLPPRDAAALADVVILGVPDDAIRDAAAEIAPAVRDGSAVVHLSGSASLEELRPASDAGARALCVHPLQTAPDVETAVARLPGSAMGVTARDEDGYALGEGLAADAGGRPFRVADEAKPLYHAAAVFCSNYLAVVEGIADRLFRRAGLADPPSAFAPLATATLANVLERGPATALTGPAARGDAGTVGDNLAALAREAPEAVAPYVALAAAALDLAVEAGRLGEEGRRRVEEVLARWR